MVLNQKRGSITDIPFIIVGLFSFILIGFLISLILYHFNANVSDNSVFDATSKDATEKISTSYPKIINGSVIFLFLSMCIISLALAAMISIHPVFIVFYIFELILYIMLGGAIADTYEVIIATEAMSPIVSYFSVTTTFFRYFPFLIGVIGFVLAMIMYKAKKPIYG